MLLGIPIVSQMCFMRPTDQNTSELTGSGDVNAVSKDQIFHLVCR